MNLDLCRLTGPSPDLHRKKLTPSLAIWLSAVGIVPCFRKPMENEGMGYGWMDGQGRLFGICRDKSRRPW